MSSSRSSRSSRKTEGSNVKQSAKETNGTDDDTEENQIEINSEESEDGSSASDLPKSRNNSSYSGSGFSMPEEIKKLLERVLCCSCGKQLNPMNPGAIRKHPWLKVVTCKKCYKFLRSGPFTRDDDGIDEQCRWCGDGGHLYGCDYCHNCFCRQCVKRNMGRSEAAMMDNDDGSKWHCYVCKPKKIRRLKDDCEKILSYIEAQDKKEKEREERRRAKQKEKEKLEKEKEKSKKEEKNEKEKEDDKDKEKDQQKDGKSTPKRGFPAPKDKLEMVSILKTEKKDEGTSKSMPVSESAPDLIVVGDSPAKVEKPHHRAVIYKPDLKTGVQHVQRISDNVTAVTVGPKNDKPVVMPFPTKGSGPSRQNAHKPLLMGMLIGSGGAPSAPAAQYNVDKVIVKKMPAQNDMRALKNNIFPHNVEGVAEKMSTMAQSLSLTLNSLKTDLAIAKLSQLNMFQAKQMAATQMKNGLEYFFNNMRELLNVQIIAKSPNDVSEDKGQGDTKPLSSSSLTSTPIKKDEALVNSKSGKLDESVIPIEIDLASPKKDEKTEKMETDEDVVVVTNNDTKDVQVLHVNNDEVVMEEKLTGQSEQSKDKENEKADEIVLDGDSLSESDSKKEIDKKVNDEDKSEKSKDTENVKSSENEKDKSEKAKESENQTDDDVCVITDTESEEKTSKSKLDVSENTAAELELLKEMADELNELEEKSKESEQPRRSGRNKHLELTDDKNESDRESPARRSSRRQKPDDDSNEKNDKRDKSSPEKGKTDSKKTAQKKEETENDNSKEKKSKKKSGSKSKIDYESEDENNDEEQNEKNGKEVKDEEKEKKLSKSKLKSSETKNTIEDSDDNTEEEVPESKDKSDEETEEEIPNIKTKKEIKNEKGSKKTKKAESKDKSDEETEEEIPNIKTKKEIKNEKGSKKTKKAESKDKSDEETEEEIPNIKMKKENKNEKGSKKTKKAEKVEENDMAIEDQVPTDMSDTTESSDESVQEFGKRKKKRKVAAKEESPKRRTRQKEKKSENNTDNSDSDPNFDSDLEKEIKSLSKSTRLTTKTKESKDRKKEKSKEKEKKGKKGPKEDEEDISSGDEDEVEVKHSKRKTRHSEKKSEENTENSDTDPDYDSDLEKQIKSLSKDTRLTRTKAKESKDSKREESKGKKEKSKGEKKGKKAADDDDVSDLSSVEDVPSDVDEDSDEDTDTNISSSQLKKLKQAGKAVLEDDSDDDVRPDDLSSDSSEDPEVSFPKLSTPKKGKKGQKHDVEELSDDSDFVAPKKKRKRVKDKLLDVKVSDSESDTGKKGKGKKGKRKRKKEDSDAFSELSDEEENRKKGKGKKRRRIKKIESSDEEKEPGADDDVGSDYEDDGTPGGFLKRKQIRKVIGSKKLTDETKAAQKAEEERRKRIEERQKEYNTYVEVEGGGSEAEEEEVPEGTEREVTTPIKTDSIAKILGSPRKVPVTTKCVLEMDKEKKKNVIEVDKTLIKKLKPHQVEAVRFMYNCCIESIERMKKGEGSGCILAHCMGLGKTLSVITFVHTMLSNVKLTKMSKCLVVCPLNTCLNWVNEFEIWLDDVDFEIEVYEMSKVKQNYERAQMLKEWHEGGAGVLIMGYDMYRNLVNGSHCKNKKQKKVFYETLADPGPDIVICDEGHILKNDVTSLSKAMSKIKSPRRVVLTGTPLQNNLGEYHCMVSFVKPSLLGTRKEFNNRFCNPITNGQCSDSTPFDVKLMKRRAHILHELLAGCVQRKDYSALTKYLPPKFEYVISVRLSKVQMTLYEKYLEMNLGSGTGEIRSKGARLFTDYQALMRIWTHPWVLKLDEIRQENKRQFDDEDDDSFINDSGSDEDSFVDDSTTSQSNSSDDDSGSDRKKKKRKTRGKKGSSSSDEDSKKENPDEVVKKWTSKRRGNEEGAGSSWMEDMGYSTGPKEVTTEWWAEFVKEADEFKLELSGKMTLMFEILKMCEDIGDKVLVFSQSLLSLDIIEDFLAKVDEANNPTNETTEADKPSTSEASSSGEPKENGTGEEKSEIEKNKERLSGYGKSWSKGLDYFRMDGSTNSQNRKASQDMFNDPENYRARLFLISTKAGSLGINLVAANRVIIFDASWNPSHDIQSIFRVYRFGQVKPVYVYRFLAQGTMEEKIYERQVTKQSLSQRVVDEHQIERHFTSSDLQELYKFQPDRLDDPEKKSRPLPILPKDHMLAELMTNNKEWIVTYHEHDSLLENVIEQELSEEEKKAAWEDYEDEKKGISKAMGGMQMNPGLLATQQMNMQTLLMHGQANLGQAAVLQIVQDLKARFPNLPPEVFQQRVQAVLRQVLTQQIMQQSEMQRRHLEQQRMNELNRLNQIKQQIQRQQAMINNQQRVYGMGSQGLQSMMSPGLRPQTLNQLPMRPSTPNFSDQQKK